MSVQNIGRNLWRVQIKTSELDPKTGQPKRISRRFHGTKDEAKTFEARFAATGGSVRREGGMSLLLGDYLTYTWLPAIDVTDSTKRDYRYGIGLVEALHQTSLEDLTPQAVEQAIQALPAGDRRKRALSTLRAALNAAVRWGEIEVNPIDRAKVNVGRSVKAKAAPDPYTFDEVELLRQALEGRPLEVVVILTTGCGLGKEEVLGLDWEDLELSGEVGIITINKAWTMDGSRPALKVTKNTHRERVVFLAGEPLVRLRELAEGKTGPIWPGVAHERIEPNAATRQFKRLVEKAGLRYVPLNCLRHTYASTAIAQGTSIAIVSQNLGHAKTSTTYDYYVRTNDAARMQAALAYARNLPKIYQNSV